MEIRSPARRVLAIASGKGGVGKSTVALNMATLLAQQGAQVGLLDCDIYGPDIAAMIGLTRRVPVQQWTLARPGGPGSTPVRPVEKFGVYVVSAGLLFGEEQHLSWPAELIGVLLNQLLWSTTWPDLDYLLIDMPPRAAAPRPTCSLRSRSPGRSGRPVSSVWEWCRRFRCARWCKRSRAAWATPRSIARSRWHAI